VRGRTAGPRCCLAALREGAALARGLGKKAGRALALEAQADAAAAPAERERRVRQAQLLGLRELVAVEVQQQQAALERNRQHVARRVQREAARAARARRLAGQRQAGQPVRADAVLAQAQQQRALGPGLRARARGVGRRPSAARAQGGAAAQLLPCQWAGHRACANMLKERPPSHHTPADKQSLLSQESHRRLLACCTYFARAHSERARSKHSGTVSVQLGRRACSCRIRFCPKPLTACVTCQRGPSPPPGSFCSTISVPSASPASTRPSHTSSASIFFWKLSSTTSAAVQTAHSGGLQGCNFATKKKKFPHTPEHLLSLGYKLHCFDCSTCEGLEVRHCRRVADCQKA